MEKDINEIIKEIEDEQDVEEIKEGNYISKIDKYWNIFYENPNNTFMDYIQENYIVFLDEIGKIKARSENIIKDIRKFNKKFNRKEKTNSTSARKNRRLYTIYGKTKETTSNIFRKQRYRFCR